MRTSCQYRFFLVGTICNLTSCLAEIKYKICSCHMDRFFIFRNFRSSTVYFRSAVSCRTDCNYICHYVAPDTACCLIKFQDNLVTHLPSFCRSRDGNHSSVLWSDITLQCFLPASVDRIKDLKICIIKCNCFISVLVEQLYRSILFCRK